MEEQIEVTTTVMLTVAEVQNEILYKNRRIDMLMSEIQTLKNEVDQLTSLLPAE